MIGKRTRMSNTSSDAELTYGLQSRFLEELDHVQKLRIFDLTTRASRELHRWAARYPLIRRMRVWPLSLSVAAAAPFASVEALVSMARVSLWVFTIDDLFDEEIVSSAELVRRIRRYKQILAGEQVSRAEERDTLVLALQDIRDDLAEYELFGELEEDWGAAVRGTLDGMMQEHEWRTHYRVEGTGAHLPTYEEYLENGLYTVGGPPHIWTALIALGDRSILDNYNRVRELGLSASTCIRLANDLRSYEKEIREAKINSVVILQREALIQGHNHDKSLDWACEVVRHEIQRELARCAALQKQASTKTGYPERAIADIARFVCDFYINHDYHMFNTAAGRSQ